MKSRRILVVWCPDWPVVSAMAEEGGARNTPAAVLASNAVVACNDAARAEGVRRGMRRRDAQSRCPDLALLSDNPDRDAAAFEPVLKAVEELRPGVAPLRPGLMAIRAPGRFYGGEDAAGAVIAEQLVKLGVWDCRVGVADDLFTAEQAARQAQPQDSHVVPVGESATFLRNLPATVLDDADVVGLLRRLGLRTLGDLAELPAADVQARFGSYGAKVHRLAGGADTSPLAARTPPPEWVCQVAFEPPLESVEAICFSIRQMAEQFVTQLADHGQVCTEVHVEAVCDGVVASSRTWAHSRWFAATDLVDRVHWQLHGQIATSRDDKLRNVLARKALQTQAVSSPVELVRFTPEMVEPTAAHAEGLWGGATDERVERAVARVQGLLGPEAVTVPVRQGGRTPSDQQALVPWGERPTALRPTEPPWPGSLPPPSPARVFDNLWPAVVVDARGQQVQVSDRGVVSGEPARFQVRGGRPHDWQPVAAWAGPWPVEELWWEEPARRIARFQIVGEDGRAWLMRCEGHSADPGTPAKSLGWSIEASYD